MSNLRWALLEGAAIVIVTLFIFLADPRACAISAIAIPLSLLSAVFVLVAWGATRGEAIARMKRALGEYFVGGIRTTIPFFLSVLDDEEFARGEIDTGYIPRFLERRKAGDAAQNDGGDARVAAAIVAAINFTKQSKTKASVAPSERASKWKLAGRIASLNNRRR